MNRGWWDDFILFFYLSATCSGSFPSSPAMAATVPWVTLIHSSNIRKEITISSSRFFLNKSHFSYKFLKTFPYISSTRMKSHAYELITGTMLPQMTLRKTQIPSLRWRLGYLSIVGNKLGAVSEEGKFILIDGHKRLLQAIL